MMWRIYDIVYETPRGDLPTEIHVDINKFNDKLSQESITFQAYKAIKEITGCTSSSCKIETILK